MVTDAGLYIKDNMSKTTMDLVMRGREFPGQATCLKKNEIKNTLNLAIHFFIVVQIKMFVYCLHTPTLQVKLCNMHAVYLHFIFIK